jgi:pimeloyl-ACP methyl ester carboxylesterase
MPYVDNKGVRIHYEVEGEGAPVVLQHGFTQSMDSWYRCGYVDALKPHYRVILVDARGHGKSDKPHERAAYAWPIGTMDVLAVLDSLNIRNACLWGYSMGGSIVLSALAIAPERVTALVAGGATGEADDIASRLQHVDGSDPEAFVAAFESLMKATFSPEVRAMVLASDTRALAAATQNRPSLMERLGTVTVPCMLYAGGRDFRLSSAQATARRIPNAKFERFPGLAHPEAFLRSDLVLPHVLTFLKGAIEGRRPNNGMEPTR